MGDLHYVGSNRFEIIQLNNLMVNPRVGQIAAQLQRIIQV